MLLITDDKEIAELEKSFYGLEREIEEIKFPGTFALRHNIYGVDLDPKAIDITAFTLMVQVYDELKEGARCPTMIGENLKVGNSLVSAITPEERDGFISRKELEEEFKDEIAEIIRLRRIEKGIDHLDDSGLRKLIEENFDDVVEIYRLIKEKYPNAIPTAQQKLLDEWHKRAKNEPIEKTFDVLITQTGLARIFLKEVFFEKIRKVKEKIEFEIERPLIRYFNSEKRVLRDGEFEEFLSDEDRIKEEFRFIKDKAVEISKSQPPKVFNWEIEFPEVFFDEDGTLKENPGFDCVVGNPPYLALKNEDIENYKLIYNLEQQIDIYHIFIIKFSNPYFISKNGYFSMIVPDPLLIRDNAAKAREHLIKTLKSVSWFHIKRVFEEALVSSVIPISRNVSIRPDKIRVLRINRELQEAKICLENKEYEEYLISYDLCLSMPNLQVLYLINEQIIKKFFKSPYIECIPIDRTIHNLKSLCSNIFRGEEIGKRFVRKLKQKGIPIILGGVDIEKYYVKKSQWSISKSKIQKDIRKYIQSKILIPKSRVDIIAGFNLYNEIFPQSVYGVAGDYKIDFRILLAQLNSPISNFIMRTLFSEYKLMQPQIELEYIGKMPVKLISPHQQTPIISLVSAIIQKKKEYHAISQNIEDYIDFKEAGIIRLDEFLKGALDDFDVVSSLKVKRDNFDALRLRIEGDKAILEYGIRRKVEDYEEIEEDEQTEVKGKYVVEWHPAGEGKIKDRLAIEFLTKMLEKEKRFSKAKTKTMWQKIAEVKVPEFTSGVREGFLKYKSLMEKAKGLDKEITKIDRAIDRLVYDLYGLAEDEIKVVEKSIWGDKFEEMYEKLASRDEALRLADEVRG